VLHVVQPLEDTFVLGLLTGDADLCASVYAPDARLIPPDRQVRTGRREIRDFWQRIMDLGGRGHALAAEVVDPRGDDRIVERGVYSRFAHPVDTDPLMARGSYLLIHERQRAGNWAWAIDLWTLRTNRPGDRGRSLLSR
jgi:ketosteroid isomerase-like protein